MTFDIPLACNLSAAEQGARGEELAPLFARVEHMQELPDGYSFAFPAEEECVHDLLRFILDERACCPFFTFELTFPSPHQSIWLALRGSEEIKHFVGETFALLPKRAVPTETEPGA